MVVPQQMLVEMGDQTAWEIHDALLLCTGSDSENATKLKTCDEYPPAFLSNGHRSCTRSIYRREGQSVQRIGLQMFQSLAVKPT